jgi:uncharacterized protein YcbK (DUF882 family)
MPHLASSDYRRHRRRFAPRERVATLVIVLLAALGVVQFFRPAGAAARGPFSRFAAAETRFVRVAAMARGGHAEASRDAFGRSGQVRMRFALPATTLEFPLVVGGGDPRTLRYEWVRLGDTAATDSSRALRGANVISPRRPGFYRLAIRRGSDREVMAEPIVAVLMPFQRKVGAMLNGYRIGTYLTERLGGALDATDHPEGFLEVGPEHVALNVSTHLTVGDFITHDSQEEVWPKYVAINPRLLDKLELVIAEVQRRRGRVRVIDLALGIHSGFRTPWHNARVPRAAGDSRHQYGDAADVVMDANGDGRITAADGMLVASAVERIEYEYPDLAGGLGLYTGRQYRTPYVHIDTRGTPARWRSAPDPEPEPDGPDIGLVSPTDAAGELQPTNARAAAGAREAGGREAAGARTAGGEAGGSAGSVRPVAPNSTQ